MMEFFILAAGFGKRMGHWTKDVPKPMLSVDGIKLLDFAFFNLGRWGLRKGTINLHYHRKVVKDHLTKIQNFHLKIAEEEQEILGTAGGIRTALGNNPFQPTLLLYNPDMILLPDEKFLPRANLPTNSKAHLYLLPKPKEAKYTGLELNPDGSVSFGKGNYYYIGLSLIDPNSLSSVVPNTYSDLSDIFRDQADKGELTGEIFSGTTLDLGEQDLYESYRNQPIFGNQKESILSFLKQNGFPT